MLDTLGLSLPLDEPEEARAALGLLAGTDDWPAWKRLWAERLARGHRAFVVPGEPPWTVIEARRVPVGALRTVRESDAVLEDGIEVSTDGDDSSFAGRVVSLAEHCSDVEALARDYARRCGLGAWLAEHVALAGWLHDVGQADRRVLLMPRGGSENEFFQYETPGAESATPPGARAARRLAQQRSGYPRGARHEVQSLAMLQSHLPEVVQRLQDVDPAREPDIDLVLHLVASHHGHCRPFAPVVLEESPVDVSLEGHQSQHFGTIEFPATTSNHGLHRLDAPLADRFWALVAKYGWQELCWLEAILRLADHRASEEEQTREGRP